MHSMIKMSDMVRRAKQQKDDIPAPKVKVTENAPMKKIHSIKTFSNFNYDMVDLESITTKSSSQEGRPAEMVLPSDVIQQLKKGQLERKKNIKAIRKQQRKLAKEVNPSHHQYVIKNVTHYVHKKQKIIGPLFQAERAILKTEKKGVPIQVDKFGTTKYVKVAPTKTTLQKKDSKLSTLAKVSTSTMPTVTEPSSKLVLNLPSLNKPLSEQTLEDEVKRNRKEIDKYRKMVDPTKIKKFSKPPFKLPILEYWRDLHIWDVSSNAKRDQLVLKFIKDYTSIEPLDLDNLLSNGSSLIFTRFVVSLQLAFERRKPIWHFVQALGLFIKSLQGERFTMEFGLMGGFATVFSALKVDELKIRDKANVLYFLYRTIEGPNGTRVKNFICRESTYLDSVVDCLTMCNNIGVIHFAELFLETMCIGTRNDNLKLVSNYIISLLPCDFNSRVQIMACKILNQIIHQQSEIAAASYEYVVDVLRTDYDPILVPISELCISIMATSTADALLKKLVEVAQPSNLSEDLNIVIDQEGASIIMMNNNEEMSAAASKKSLMRKSSANLQDVGEMDQPPPTTAQQQQQQDQNSDELADELESDGNTLDLASQMDKSMSELGEYDENDNNNDENDGRAGGNGNSDIFCRQQLGSLFVLGFMLKNRKDFGTWMIQKGVIGSLLSAIGTASFFQVQLSAIRLLLLLHEATSDCVAALTYLLPKKLISIILEKGENALFYITAVHCVVLRRLGRLVQQYWEEWFKRVVLIPSKSTAITGEDEGDEEDKPSTLLTTAEEEEEEEEVGEVEEADFDDYERKKKERQRKSRLSSGFTERPITAVLQEISSYSQKLEELIGDSFDNVIATMDLIMPDEEFYNTKSQDEGEPVSARLAGKASDELTLGEAEILRRDNLEPFRKHLDMLNDGNAGKGPADEFEKYYVAQFGQDGDVEMGGMELAALQEAEKALGRLKEGEVAGRKGSEEAGEIEGGSFDFGVGGSHASITPLSDPGEGINL